MMLIVFFFSSRRRHTRWNCDWSSDVCSSDLLGRAPWDSRDRPPRHGRAEHRPPGRLAARSRPRGRCPAHATRPVPGPTRPAPRPCATPRARRFSSRSRPRPRRRASDPPNPLPGSSALVLLLGGRALEAAERERRGWPYTGPPGGHFLLNLGRRSLADRDSLGVSLRGLCAARSSGQQAPGRRASAASHSFLLLPPLLPREPILSCAPE